MYMQTFEHYSTFIKNSRFISSITFKMLNLQITSKDRLKPGGVESYGDSKSIGRINNILSIT